MARTIKEVMDYYRSLEEGHRAAPLYPHTSTPVKMTEAALIFYKSELTDDIAQLAYVEGDVMPKDSHHESHQVMDVVEDGNKDRVNRVLDFGIDECREMLYPYSRVPVMHGEEEVNVLFDEPVYRIDMLLPADFSKTTLSYLEKLIHEYLVCKVMADWMSITNLNNKNSAVNWAGRLPEIEGKIKSAVNMRMHRVRRTQTPF